jgi:hypothetical protein
LGQLALVITLAAAWLPGTVLAQSNPGSTGGSIGLQNKSISGETNAPASGNSRAKREPSSTQALSGTWVWQAQCGGVVGAQSASFAIDQSSAGGFRGQFVGSNTWGTIENGRINGNELTFDRVGGPLGISEHWRARLAGSSHMDGSSVGAVSCRFTASK